MSRADVPDALYPTTNGLGIPELRPESAATAILAPVCVWGSRQSRRTKWRGTTLCFFCDDHRFEALWADPSHLLETECRSIVEPNFSVYDQSPRVLALWQTYRKRYLARWWGDNGIKILVDLNVPRKYERINLLGVPRGWGAFSTHGYSERIGDLEHEYGVAARHHGGEAGLVFLCYGGGAKVRDACRSIGPSTIVWVPEMRTELRDEKRAPKLKVA